MEQLGHPTLVGYSSVAEMERGRKPRFTRPRTIAYAALLAGLLITGGTMLYGRVPFQVTVNRAPGSLYTVDPDGLIRNTYLLKITSNVPSPEPAEYTVRVEGLEDAEVIAPPLILVSSESRTAPLVVRVRNLPGVRRTVPIRVYVESPHGAVIVDATFKTGADVGAIGTTD
jgi:polyferredoxin